MGVRIDQAGHRHDGGIDLFERLYGIIMPGEQIFKKPEECGFPNIQRRYDFSRSYKRALCR
jgi:hypothetical protein